jgi:single-strand DNA-binding protein
MTAHPYHRNEVHFIGRLGRDPEMSYTNGGKAVTRLSLAVNQGKEKAPIWMTVTCWEDLAEQVGKNEHAVKGALIGVDGRLTQRKYNNITYTEMTADEVEVMNFDSKKKKDDKEEEVDPEQPF